jgi:hypothetical protein
MLADAQLLDVLLQLSSAICHLWYAVKVAGGQRIRPVFMCAATSNMLA